jgi:hypothetical protein
MQSNTNPADVVNYTPPGISWTAPEKSRPWQQPPQLVNMMDVCGYYIMNMSRDEMLDDLLDVVETPVPLAVTAEAMMLQGVSNGIHSVDMGILVMPVIIEMLITIADHNKSEYTIYPDDYDKEAKVSNRVARLAVERAMKKIESKDVSEEEETPVVKEPKGLMAKRKEVM